ncbi:3-hydroxybenzoate 6-hydroxylase 1 [Tolypocladium paradoxum]|uniref:3-hydroxybenzoate 6-hydroxylase 1 n=1 Tax=Tolypocladium paradoxum TaxID=94208 RepID=A0A2S4KU84_9HYPO|nr:3-hydroxybenzoate 6-hydroxylase 1 [Tolypocladium paradoxum]
MPQVQEMPLEVIVVGAGIGGLCTAVAMQQAGHSVKVFEKSRFAAEVGAALLVTPNGERVLSRLGFDFTRARADDMTCFEVLDGVTFEPLSRADLSQARKEFGAPLYTVHRVDLHNELLRLTSDLDIRLASRVVAADAEQGFILLEDGTRHHADLIIGADGLHSVLRGVVLGDQDAAKATPSGMSAFRFMIPTSQLQDDPHFRELLKLKGRGNSVLADTAHQTERHMVWYTCRDGQIQNFAGIHESMPTGGDVCFPFYPFILRDYRGGLTRETMQMLPFGAQGANQAIEDAGALGAIFSSSESTLDVAGRLGVFERVRRLRASRVQTMSKVRLGKEGEVEAELRQYADPPGSGAFH